MSIIAKDIVKHFARSTAGVPSKEILTLGSCLDFEDKNMSNTSYEIE